MKQIGTRVKITAGMREFVGQLGTIIDDSERDGRAVLYRVRLDAPVSVANVGMVADDLWQGRCLRIARGRRP